MSKNEKTLRVKKYKKLVGLWKKIRIPTFITVGLLCLIPLPFCCFFCDDGHSVGLGFIHSSLSVSDWFSFWTTLVAGLASTFVAILALRLSLTVERRALEEKRSNEKLLFCPTNVVLRETEKGDSYMFVIYMPQKVMLLEHKDCEIKAACYNGTNFSMQIDSQLDDWQPHIILQCNKDTFTLDNFNKLVSQWKKDSWFFKSDEYMFRLKLCFKYNALDYRDIEHTYNVGLILNLVYENENFVRINPTFEFAAEDRK